MAHIGNRAHAQEILNYCRDNNAGSLPDGWSHVGSGCFRTAYRHDATGVVYKVDHSYRGGRGDGAYCSRNEVRNAQRLIKRTGGFIGKFVRIPKVSGFKFGKELVVAMEAIVGTLFADLEEFERNAYHLACLELYNVGFEDMHNRNFFLDSEGYLVPVDMACSVKPGKGDLRTISSYRSVPEIQKVLESRGW